MTKEEQKEYNSKYYQEHREKAITYGKNYYSVHKEEVVAYNRAHKEEKAIYDKNYRRIHKKEIVAYDKRYRSTHRKGVTETKKRWKDKNPEKVRESVRKEVSKRRRNLGYIPINKPFKGSNFHHLDKDSGIYIPAWLHKMYPHNVFTGKNMDKMNDIAIRWWIINRCREVR